MFTTPSPGKSFSSAENWFARAFKPLGCKLQDVRVIRCIWRRDDGRKAKLHACSAAISAHIDIVASPVDGYRRAAVIKRTASLRPQSCPIGVELHDHGVVASLA